MIRTINNNKNLYYNPFAAALLASPAAQAIGSAIGGAAIGGLAGKYLAGQQAAALAGANKLQMLGAAAQASATPPTLQDIQLARYETPQQFTSVGGFTPVGYTPELYTPEEYQLAGTLTAEELSPTQLRNILINQQARQAQLDVLQKYQQQGEQGLTAIDRAALVDIQNELARQERGQREAILANMAQRGIAGGGQELAANLLAGQESAQRASEEGMRIAAQEQANRQEALARVAQLSGGIEATDYARLAKAAEAQDIINRFNLQNRLQFQAENLQNLQDVLNRRTAEEIRASQFGAEQKTAARQYLSGLQNLSEQQRLEREQAVRNLNTEQAIRQQQANIELANQERLYNIAEKPRLQYGLQSQYTTGISNALGGIAQSQAQQAMNQYQTQAGLIGTGLQAGGTLGSAFVMRPSTPVAQPEPRPVQPQQVRS